MVFILVFLRGGAHWRFHHCMEQALTRSSRPNPGLAAIRNSLQPLEIPGGAGILSTGNPFAAHQGSDHHGSDHQGATSPGVIDQASAPVALAASLAPPGSTSAVDAPSGSVPPSAGRAFSRHTSANQTAANQTAFSHHDAGCAEFSVLPAPGSSSGSANAFSREVDALHDETLGRRPQRRTAPRQAIVQSPSTGGGDPLVEGLSLLAGVTIGLLTLLVPLLSVISDRPAGSGWSAEPAASSGRHR
jgi:hypothetical protein